MSIMIISGSRRITDYSIVDTAICASGFSITMVVEGGQRTWDVHGHTIIGGVDYFAEIWARRNRVPWKRINAKWSQYGKQAGPIRNREMAQLGEQLIAIPDSESVGTLDMIEAAQEAGFKPEQIYIYDVKDPL